MYDTNYTRVLKSFCLSFCKTVHLSQFRKVQLLDLELPTHPTSLPVTSVSYRVRSGPLPPLYHSTVGRSPTVPVHCRYTSGNLSISTIDTLDVLRPLTESTGVRSENLPNPSHSGLLHPSRSESPGFTLSFSASDDPCPPNGTERPEKFPPYVLGVGHIDLTSESRLSFKSYDRGNPNL